jgi:protein ImuB
MEISVFGALYAAEGMDRAALEAVAREFSPRIEVCGPREITLDLGGLERLFGDARVLAHELRRTAADRGLQVRVAIAGTRTAARLFVHHRAGISVIEPGMEAEMLASLPLSLLSQLSNISNVSNDSNDSNASNDSNDLVFTLRRWGLRTLGEFAALPPDEVAARLGHAGVEWQRLARGDDQRPLVPASPEERFEQTLELDWPIEGLEPLSFVLGRLMEPLSVHLERRDRGAAVLYVRLHLVNRTVHERSLQLPAPMRDARALRTLALLDLESHPPDAAIYRVTVAVDPTPGRVVQFSLLTRPLPSPEQLSTLAARLAAVMGEGRCGSPELVDSWRPGAFAMKPFAPRDSSVHAHEPRRREDAEKENFGLLRDSATPRPVAVNVAANPTVALRRFRMPIPARVHVEEGRPVRVWIDRRGFGGGGIKTAAGPWRTSGAWWEPAPVRRSPQGEHGLVTPKPRSGEGGWNRDEWDVALADGVTYRLYRERCVEGGWFVEGIVD